MTALVPLPVLLPLMGAAISLILSHHPKAQRRFSLGVLFAVMAVAAALLVLADTRGPQVVWIGLQLVEAAERRFCRSDPKPVGRRRER